VKSKEYVLITLHRPSNVDEMDKLKEIFDGLEVLSKTNKLVYPIHPRTKKNLKKIGYLEKVENNKNIILQDPLGYLEFTCLMANCNYLVTDSGGLQEESTALDIPCFTLRENTERPSTLIENNGTNQMISRISEMELKPCKGSMDLWDGKSSYYICYHIHYSLYIYSNNNIVITNFNHFTNHLDNLDIKENYSIAYSNNVKKNKNQYIYGDIILKNTLKEKGLLNNTYLDRTELHKFKYDKVSISYGKYFCINANNNNFKLNTDFFGNQIIYYYHKENKFIITDNFNYLLNILKDNKFCIEIKNFKKIRFNTAIDDYISNYNIIKYQNVVYPYEHIEFNSDVGFNICHNKITNYFLYEEDNVSKKVYNKYIDLGINEIKNNLLSVIKFSEREKLDIIVDLTAGLDSRVLFSVILENNLQNKFLFNCDETSGINVDLRYFMFFINKFGLNIYKKEKVETTSTYDVINIWRNNYIHFRPGFPRIKNKKIIRLSSGFGELYRTFYKKYKNNVFIPYQKDILKVIGNSYDIQKENHYMFYRHRIHFTEGMDLYSRNHINEIIFHPLQSKFLLKASKCISFEERHNRKVLYDCVKHSYLKQININNSEYIDVYKKIKVSDISIDELQNNIKLYKNQVIKIHKNNFDVVEVIFKKELRRLYKKYNICYDIDKYSYRDILRFWKYYINYEYLDNSKVNLVYDTIKVIENDDRVLYSFAQGIPDITNNDLVELTKNIKFNKKSFMYSKPCGFLHLRKKILEHYSYKYNHDEILITSGIINSLFCFLSTVDNPSVALVEPFYIAYSKFSILNINIQKFTRKNFSIKNILDANCNTLIITIPNNPDGYIYDVENIIMNCNYYRINLFIDLAYIVFLEQNNPTYNKLLDLINKYKNVVWSFSFSKTIKCSGLRIGYCLSNKKIISNITKIHNYINNCANTIGQTLIYNYLCNDTYKLIINNHRTEIKEIKKYILDNNLFIYNKNIIKHNIDNNIYFLYLKLDKKVNVKDLVEKLLKKGIGVVNGKDFENNANSIRICLARNNIYFDKLKVIDKMIENEF
jgi:aspartate/methionine/tyrosine aminotransferase